MWQRLWLQSSWSMWHHRSHEVEEFLPAGGLARTGFVQGRTGSKVWVTYANSDPLGTLIHMLIIFPHCSSANQGIDGLLRLIALPFCLVLCQRAASPVPWHPMHAQLWLQQCLCWPHPSALCAEGGQAGLRGRRRAQPSQNRSLQNLGEIWICLPVLHVG